MQSTTLAKNQKRKIHIVIVIGIGNTFNKNSISIFNKTLSILIENSPNLIKGNYKQSGTKITTANTALDDRRIILCPEARVGQGICSSLRPSDAVLESWAA